MYPDSQTVFSSTTAPAASEELFGPRPGFKPLARRLLASSRVPRPAAALLLLAAGAKGKRYALPNSRVMIHQPLGGFQGQATDIEIHAREILSMKQRLNEILSKHTGQALDTIARDTDRDNFMTADEAKVYGLVDEVVQSRKEIPGLIEKATVALKE